MRGIAPTLRSLLAALNVPVARSGAAMVASSLAGAGSGFLYWVVAARLLDAADVGVAAAVISAMTTVGTLAQSGVHYIGLRYLPVAGHRRTVLMRTMVALVAAIATAAGALFLAGSAIWAERLARTSGPVLVGCMPFWAVFMLQDNILLALGRAAWVTLKNTLFGVGKLVLLVVAAGGLGATGWMAVAWPWFAATIVGVLGVWILIERFASRQPWANEAADLPRVGTLGRFALANHVGSILLQLPALIYPLAVFQLLGPVATAYFYTSWMIAYLLMLVAGNFAAALLAHAASAGEDLDVLLVQGVVSTSLLVIPGVLVVLLFGGALLSSFGPGYTQSHALLSLLALGALGYAANNFYASVMRARARLTPVLIQGGIAGGVSVGLAWPLAKELGLTGFGLAFALGQLLAAAIVWAPQLRALRRSGGASLAWSLYRVAERRRGRTYTES